MKMKKWQLAEYLMESKKVIDSIMFININVKEMNNLDLKSIIDEKLQKFYINLRVIYDKCLSKEEKENLRNNDAKYQETLYHRDKKYAHKDEKYKKKEYESKEELICDLKEKITHCYDMCKNKLPKEITFDFIPYDRNLYRMLKNITPQKEQRLKEIMNDSNIDICNDNSRKYKVFNDIEDINYIKDSNEYAVILDNGINLYEGLQNRQDACVKINLLHNLNIWCKVSENIDEIEKEYEMLVEKILEI